MGFRTSVYVKPVSEPHTYNRGSTQAFEARRATWTKPIN